MRVPCPSPQTGSFSSIDQVKARVADRRATACISSEFFTAFHLFYLSSESNLKWFSSTYQDKTILSVFSGSTC